MWREHAIILTILFLSGLASVDLLFWEGFIQPQKTQSHSPNRWNDLYSEIHNQMNTVCKEVESVILNPATKENTKKVVQSWKDHDSSHCSSGENVIFSKSTAFQLKKCIQSDANEKREELTKAQLREKTIGGEMACACLFVVAISFLSIPVGVITFFVLSACINVENGVSVNSVKKMIDESKMLIHELDVILNIRCRVCCHV